MSQFQTETFTFPLSGGPVPLFPIPNLFLIPGALLPLNVVGSRFRPMVEELLDSNGLLVLGTALDVDIVSEEDGVEPHEVEPIGGLGYLETYEVIDEDRYLILPRGLARVTIEELSGDHPYRQTMYRVLEEAPVPEESREALDRDLRDAIAHRAGPELELPNGLALGQLADLLLMHLQLEPNTMNEVYGIAEAEARAERVLAEYRTIRDTLDQA